MGGGMMILGEGISVRYYYYYYYFIVCADYYWSQSTRVTGIGRACPWKCDRQCQVRDQECVTGGPGPGVSV